MIGGMKTVFDKWTDAAALARALNLPPQTVRAWRLRGSIPAKYDIELIRVTKKILGQTITIADFAKERAASRQ